MTSPDPAYIFLYDIFVNMIYYWTLGSVCNVYFWPLLRFSSVAKGESSWNIILSWNPLRSSQIVITLILSHLLVFSYFSVERAEPTANSSQVLPSYPLAFPPSLLALHQVMLLSRVSHSPSTEENATKQMSSRDFIDKQVIHNATPSCRYSEQNNSVRLKHFILLSVSCFDSQLLYR